MAKGPTKREMLSQVYALLTNLGEVELAEFTAREIALYDKRANAPRTMTTAQRENEVLKGFIVSMLGDTPGLRATAIAKELDVSVQKVSALLRQLVKDGAVIRNEDGKTVTFTV
jgi:predicted transcriptional regulator